MHPLYPFKEPFNMTKQIEFTAGLVNAAMEAAGAKKRDVFWLHPDNFHVEPGFNVREHTAEYDSHIDNISALIEANGYDASKPLTVFASERDGKQILIVIDGHTRLAAAKRAIAKGAPIESIPAVTTPKGTNMADLTVKLVTANEGRPLSTGEKATVIKRLAAMNLTELEIAARLNINVVTVKNALTLAEAPAAVRAMVAEGTVSATQAIATVKAEGGAAAVETLGKAVESAKAAGKKKATKKTVAKVGGKVQAKYKIADFEAMAKELLSIQKDAGAVQFPEHERMVAVFFLAADMLK